MYILASLARGECHGYGIARDAEELSDGRVRLTAGTLYGALNRLTDDGLVEPAGEQEVQGRRRRYYRLTAAGEVALAAEVERLRSTAAVLGARLSSHAHRSGAGMRRRVLELSLLAYPRQVRQRDGDHLLGLALELADSHGAAREAFGLLRGGLAERRRSRPDPARGGRRGRRHRVGAGRTDVDGDGSGRARRGGPVLVRSAVRRHRGRGRVQGPGGLDLHGAPRAGRRQLAMHPRLRWAAAAVVATLLLSSCESDEPPPEKEAERADVLHASDVPDGSSGSLVAVRRRRDRDLSRLGRVRSRDRTPRPGATPSTTSGR